MPHTQHRIERLPSFKPLLIRHDSTRAKSIESGSSDHSSNFSQDTSNGDTSSGVLEADTGNKTPTSLIESFVGRGTRERNQTFGNSSESGTRSYVIPKDKQKLINKFGGPEDGFSRMPVFSDGDTQEGAKSELILGDNPGPIRDINHCIGSQQPLAEQSLAEIQEQQIPLNQLNDINRTSSIVQTAFDRMRPKRTVAEVATITIGSNITTAILGSTPSKRRRISASPLDELAHESTTGELSQQMFGNSMRTFAAPGTRSPRFADQQSGATHPLKLPDLEDDSTSPKHQSNETDLLGIAGGSSHQTQVGAQMTT